MSETSNTNESQLKVATPNMITSPDSALFRPIRLGNIILSHRVVHAPLTRYRSDSMSVPTDLTIEYYAQRASVPGTLIITEGAFVSGQASGLPHASGIWTDEQVAAWKKVCI